LSMKLLKMIRIVSTSNNTYSNMSDGKKHLGECKWFNSKKGFGFITPKDGSEDVFVHQTAIRSEGFRSLAEKEPVEYEVAKDDKNRLKAINVSGVNGANVQGAPKPRPRYYNRKPRDPNAPPREPRDPNAPRPPRQPKAAAPAQ